MRQRVSGSFSDQKFMHFIGAKLTQVDFGFTEIELPFRKELTQQHGLFHGGIVATIADNASGFAAFSLMSQNQQPLSIEFKINLMAKSIGEKIIARGKVLKNGKRIKVCQSEIFCLKNNSEYQSAVALVSIFAFEEKTKITK